MSEIEQDLRDLANDLASFGNVDGTKLIDRAIAERARGKEAVALVKRYRVADAGFEIEIENGTVEHHGAEMDKIEREMVALAKHWEAEDAEREGG